MVIGPSFLQPALLKTAFRFRTRRSAGLPWMVLFGSQGAGDETLRFWSVFPGAKSKGSSLHNSDMLSPSRAHIR